MCSVSYEFDEFVVDDFDDVFLFAESWRGVFFGLFLNILGEFEDELYVDVCFHQAALDVFDDFFDETVVYEDCVSHFLECAAKAVSEAS